MTHRSLVHLDLPVREVGHGFEGVDWDEHGPDVGEDPVLHEPLLQVLAYCRLGNLNTQNCLSIKFNFQYNKQTNNSIFNFSKTHLSNNVLFTSMKCYWHFTMPCCWVFYIYILVDMKKWRVKICIFWQYVVTTLKFNTISWFTNIELRSNVIFIMFMFMISWPCVWNLLVVCCFCWAEKMFCWAELYRGIIGINICVAK